MITYEQAKDLAKKAGLNIEHYDHVHVWTNDRYTNMYVEFSQLVVCGGERFWHNVQTIKKSVSAMLKRNEWPDDYETNGTCWIHELKK